MLKIHIEFLKSQDIVHHNDVDKKETKKKRKKEFSDVATPPISNKDFINSSSEK